MDVTIADLAKQEIELLPSREALAFTNIGGNFNFSPAVAGQFGSFGSATTALAFPVQVLTQF
jgi:hypothetical protein